MGIGIRENFEETSATKRPSLNPRACLWKVTATTAVLNIVPPAICCIVAVSLYSAGIDMAGVSAGRGGRQAGKDETGGGAGSQGKRQGSGRPSSSRT